ncbi:MAG: DNA-3-methyladenine glycosylase family protein [Flavobacteriales bacterium]
MMKRLDREFRAHLAESDPDMYRLVKPNPTLALPAPRPPFEGLVRIVAGQQLSVKAASTVFARVTEACGGIVSPETVQRCGHLGLRAAGLSQAKVLSVLALADYAGPEANRLLRACEKPWAEIRPELLAVRGIGPWSADMFAMFVLGLPDVFAPGDLGLRTAMERNLGLAPNQKPAIYDRRALVWSPYRTLACLHLWESLKVALAGTAVS